MTINGISSSTELGIMRSIYAAAYAPSVQGNSIGSQSGGTTDNLQISAVGNLMNAVSQMSSTDQASMKSFMDDLVSSVQNGTFDASTTASSAPSALTSYAKENGIDLTTLVQDLADGAGNNGHGIYGPPPPSPPIMADMTDASGATSASSLDLSSLENLSDSDKAKLQSFLKDLQSSVKDGTFDATTMAANAPDSLTSVAKANGIDLTQMLQDMATGVENKGAHHHHHHSMTADTSSTTGTTSADLSSLENMSSSDKSTLESLLTTLVQKIGSSSDTSDLSSSSMLDLSSLQSLSSNDKTTLESFFSSLVNSLTNETESETGSDKTLSAASA
jgi:hypothetical protein